MPFQQFLISSSSDKMKIEIKNKNKEAIKLSRLEGSFLIGRSISNVNVNFIRALN